MSEKDVELDPLANSELTRESITPRAREPQDHLARPGWGAWDPDGPLVQDPENTYKGVVDVADPQSHRASLDPERSDPTGNEVPLVEPGSKDFRHDEYEPELIRPVTEAPPSER